jgi:hypothetical protein
MKKLALLLCLFAFGCASGTRHAQMTEAGKKGREIQINVSADDVLSTAVHTLMNDGFVPKTINKEFGFVNFEPKSMSTGDFYKKVGIPGGSFMNLSTSHSEEIHLNCTVTPVDNETSILKLKAQVFSVYVKAPSIFSGRPPDAGTSRNYVASMSGYAADHYFEKILEACGVKKPTAQ